MLKMYLRQITMDKDNLKIFNLNFKRKIFEDCSRTDLNKN